MLEPVPYPLGPASVQGHHRSMCASVRRPRIFPGATFCAAGVNLPRQALHRARLSSAPPALNRARSACRPSRSFRPGQPQRRHPPVSDRPNRRPQTASTCAGLRPARPQPRQPSDDGKRRSAPSASFGSVKRIGVAAKIKSPRTRARKQRSVPCRKRSRTRHPRSRAARCFREIACAATDLAGDGRWSVPAFKLLDNTLAKGFPWPAA